MPIAIKTIFGHVLSGRMSNFQNNESFTLIVSHLNVKLKLETLTVFYKNNWKSLGRLNILTLKLTFPVFLKVFVRIFVTIQMKPNMKFYYHLKMIMKFCQIILHIGSID